MSAFSPFAEVSVVNLSTVYSGLPLLQRGQAAAADGFKEVESWWEFSSALPPAAEVDDFLNSLTIANVELIALNAHGGARSAGERGLASLPDRVEEFRASILSLVQVASLSPVRLFNVPAGNRDYRYTEAEQLRTASENYRWASTKLAAVRGTLLIEPLNRRENPLYLYHSCEDVRGVLEDLQLKGRNAGLLFDTFHLAQNGIDLMPAWHEFSNWVRHIQIADFPGRGKPGSGMLDLSQLLEAVKSSGYQGRISYEYLPTTSGP